jgi:hypothetical protein
LPATAEAVDSTAPAITAPTMASDDFWTFFIDVPPLLFKQLRDKENLLAGVNLFLCI